MFLLVSGGHICAPKRGTSKGHKQGVSKQSFINFGKTFFQISRIWNIAKTWFLALKAFCIFKSGLSYCVWWKEDKQRHPTTVFCKISVRRSKFCLEFSIAWIGPEISRWAFHSGTIFEAYLKNSLRFSED